MLVAKVRKMLNDKKSTAEDFYTRFIIMKNYETKRTAFDFVIKNASGQNKKITARTKALGILCYINDMCCVNDVSENYIDGKVLCMKRRKIIEIVDSNCVDLLQRVNSGVLKKRLHYLLIAEVVMDIVAFSINTRTVRRLVSVMCKSFQLRKKASAGVLTDRESYIYNMLSVNKELKKIIENSKF